MAVQRAGLDPASLAPGEVLQLQRTAGNRATSRLLQNGLQRQVDGESRPATQKEENRTGLPDGLKAGVEALSGMDMSDVRVHYRSTRPAQVNALAYAQGAQIHLGPGQEEHLAHEAWHVVQQKQNQVQPTLQMKGIAVNDDPALEREAEVMGARAWQGAAAERQDLVQSSPSREVTQGIFGLSYLAQLAEHLGVQVGLAPVAAALGVSAATLTAGLAIAATVVGAIAIPRIIEYCTGKKEAPGLPAEEVLALMNYVSKKSYWAPGKRVYIRKIASSLKDKICHHYAFGGLKGTDESDFRVDNLAAKLGAPEVEGEYGFPMPHIASLEGQVVDVPAKIAGVPDEGQFNVRVYDDIMHSARFENGRWWHRLSDLPVPCLISVEGNENLNYSVTAALTIRSCFCSTEGEQSFVMA